MASIDFDLYTGEEVKVRLSVVDENSAIKSLANTTGVFRIGSKTGDRTLFEKSTSLVTDGTDGLMQVQLLKQETRDFPPKIYDYQFVVIDSDGSTQVVKDGRISIKQQIPATSKLAGGATISVTTSAAITG